MQAMYSWLQGRSCLQSAAWGCCKTAYLSVSLNEAILQHTNGCLQARLQVCRAS